MSHASSPPIFRGILPKLAYVIYFFYSEIFVNGLVFRDAFCTPILEHIVFVPQIFILSASVACKIRDAGIFFIILTLEDGST